MQSDDEPARYFDRCFETTCAPLLAYAIRRSPDRSAAEDLVAEVFAVAWRRRDEIPQDALPWLYGVARKLLLNQGRSLRRRDRLFARLAAEPQAVARDPADRVEELDTVRRALGALRPADREVLMLDAWEGLDATAAATVLGCRVAAYRARLSRARRAFTVQIAAQQHDLPTAPKVALAATPREDQ